MFGGLRVSTSIQESSTLLFTIRNYRPEDFETLWGIDQLCFPPGIAYSRYELDIYIHRRHAFTLVAEDSGGKIIGFLVADVSRKREGHVVTIDVLSSERQQGVGSSLLQAAESRLRSVGSSVVHLETAVDNAPAVAFYKRHGYDVIGTAPRYYSNGVDALVLEKHLLPPGPSR